MFFNAKEEELPQSGRLVYIRDDWSISFDAHVDEGDADCSVLVINLNIDFDLSTKKANNIWGYHPHTMWIYQRLCVPHHFPGRLLLLGDALSFQDVKRIEESLTWETYYDSESGWLCVGDKTEMNGDMVVEFLTNVLAVIRQNELKALWLKPVFV